MAVALRQLNPIHENKGPESFFIYIIVLTQLNLHFIWKKWIIYFCGNCIIELSAYCFVRPSKRMDANLKLKPEILCNKARPSHSLNRVCTYRSGHWKCKIFILIVALGKILWTYLVLCVFLFFGFWCFCIVLYYCGFLNWLCWRKVCGKI